jgi:hypothetical protein
MAILRLVRGREPHTPTTSSGASLFGGLGNFVDSTVKFLVTGADGPAAPIKVDTATNRSTGPQLTSASASAGSKVVFFNPHAGRSQIAQQLHQQPAPQIQQEPFAAGNITEQDNTSAMSAALDTAPPPASPPPKLDRSNSDPVKSDGSKGSLSSPAEKPKAKGGWGIGSFIGGIVSKVLPTSKGVEVDLGEESTMYYNEKLGRYVERGKEDEVAASVVGPPPITTAWSEQAAPLQAAAASVTSQSSSSDDRMKAAAAAGLITTHAPDISAPLLASTATGPPMPSGVGRPAAPPSSALKSRSFLSFLVALYFCLVCLLDVLFSY